MFWIEVAVVGGFTLAYVLSAVFMFKPAHVEHHPVRVYVGAALHGVILGLLIGFVILPLRFAFFAPDPSFLPPEVQAPRGLASISIVPAFILLIIIRQGLLARAPIIGLYFRAYRRASLKWQIDGASKSLARLEAMDDRKKAAA